MEDEKDRYGDKLHDVEKAREDQWAHDQDEKLIENQRKLMAEHKQAGAALKCPQCGKPLVASSRGGVAMMSCPDGHGAWLETGSLQGILKPGKAK